MCNLKNEWRAFYRKKMLLVLTLLSQLLLNGYWWNETRQARYDNPLWGYYTLYGMFACFALYFIPLLYLSYEYMSQTFQGETGEILVGLRAKLQAAGAKVLVLNSYVVFTCLSFGGWSVFVFQHHDLPASLLPQWGKAVGLYFILLGELAILLGFALSLLRRRLASVLAVLAIVFLTTDLSESLWIFLEQLGLPTRLIHTLFLPGLPTGSLAGNSYYGFPVEGYRLILLLFWFACILLLILIVLPGVTGAKKASAAILPLLFLTFCTSRLLSPGGYPLWGSEDFYYVGDRENNFNGDGLYYQSAPAMEETRGRFAVTSYTMDLRVTDRLEVAATLELDRQLPQYDFTLMHSYRVLSVQTEEGVPLPYVQRGDLLTVDDREGVTRISLRYQGANKLYYSSDQALNLPGYWAYYPRAGSTRTFGRVRGLGDGFYFPLQDWQPVDMRLTVKAPYPVYTHLDKQPDGSYAGQTTGLTLIGGLVSERTGQNGAVGVRAELYARERDLQVNDLLPNLEKAVDQLREEYPALEEIQLPPTLKTIQVPQLVNDTGAPYVLNDHIVYKDYLNSRELAAALAVMQLDTPPQKREVAGALQEYWADENGFLEVSMGGGLTGRYTTRYAYVRGSIADAVQNRGSQPVVNEILAYLTDSADTRTPYQFLWELQREGVN